MLKRIINFFKKEKKIKNKCIRCGEIGVNRDSVYVLHFNGFKINICQHHMAEFIDTLKKDKTKIDLLNNITLEHENNK